jgi:hypothetical protein
VVVSGLCSVQDLSGIEQGGRASPAQQRSQYADRPAFRQTRYIERFDQFF